MKVWIQFFNLYLSKELGICQCGIDAGMGR
jgi:hypothetical protein